MSIKRPWASKNQSVVFKVLKHNEPPEIRLNTESSAMKRNPLAKSSQFFVFFVVCFSIVSSELAEEVAKKIGCQQMSISGHSYTGEAKTTVDGIPCQKWSDLKPHDHGFTYVGDHNFCRNPWVPLDSRVWCFTTDPAVQFQYCPVPFCPPLKALDFSLDNDWKPDENNSYTHASLQKENLPPSFTICTAFMVEA